MEGNGKEQWHDETAQRSRIQRGRGIFSPLWHDSCSLSVRYVTSSTCLGRRSGAADQKYGRAPIWSTAFLFSRLGGGWPRERKAGKPKAHCAAWSVWPWLGGKCFTAGQFLFVACFPLTGWWNALRFSARLSDQGYGLAPQWSKAFLLYGGVFFRAGLVPGGAETLFLSFSTITTSC